MNKISRVFSFLCLTVVAFLAFTSCATKQEKFVNNLSCFVADVEEAANAGEITTADWEMLDEEFKNYHIEYQELSKSLTKDQQRDVGELYAKYAKLRLIGLGGTVNDYCGFLEGVIGELGDSLDSIEDSILGLLDSDDDND